MLKLKLRPKFQELQQKYLCRRILSKLFYKTVTKQIQELNTKNKLLTLLCMIQNRAQSENLQLTSSELATKQATYFWKINPFQSAANKRQFR